MAGVNDEIGRAEGKESLLPRRMSLLILRPELGLDAAVDF